MRMSFGLLLISLGFLLTAPLRLEARISSAAILRMLDADNDATVDAAEADSAAAKLFDRLDSDHDGTLDAAELQGRLSVDEISSGNPDHNKTLNKTDYMAIVDERFKTADANRDGKLDIQEISSPAGDAIVKLLILRILV